MSFMDSSFHRSVFAYRTEGGGESQRSISGKFVSEIFLLALRSIVFPDQMIPKKTNVA